MTVSFADTLASIPSGAPAMTIPVGLVGDDTLKTLDLAKAPHILYAGATGSGKSVGLNAGICTLMKRNDPRNLRFIMIDPKRVELSSYRKSAFVESVITDMDAAAAVLDTVVEEMERRYSQFEAAEVKNIQSYNGTADEKLPYWVLVVDELADLMDTHAATVLPTLVRLGQLARAAGIHMMLATQRPAADTTPKKLVANIPTRIGFMTQSATESRIILGSKGAEDLRGNGDLLAQIPGSKGLVRAQGPFVAEGEISNIVDENPKSVIDIEPTAVEPRGVFEETEFAEPTAAEPSNDTVEALAEEFRAQAQAQVDRIDAQLWELREKYDALREENYELKVAVKTAEAQTSLVRGRLEQDVAYAREQEAKKLAAAEAKHAARIDKVTKRIAKVRHSLNRVTAWILIAALFSALAISGTIAIGLPWMGAVVPLVIGIVTATSIKDIKSEEEENDGQHV